MAKKVTKGLKKSESTSPESAADQFDALMQKRDEEREQDPFLWLDQLVGLRIHSPAEIATAIEDLGIYGWDRYGRYDFREPGSAEAQRALDALAMAHSVYMRQRSYQCDEIDALPLGEFGWPSSACPDFEQIKAGNAPEPTKRAPDIRPENSSLAVIGALLLALKGKIGGGTLDGNDKEQPIIDVITDEVDGYGISRRNLQDKFAAAKRLVKVKAAD